MHWHKSPEDAAWDEALKKNQWIDSCFIFYVIISMDSSEKQPRDAQYKRKYSKLDSACV